MTSNRRKFLSNALKTAGIAASIGIIGGTSVHAKGGRKNKNSSGSSSLSEEKKDKLFYIFQEEKVARDVYITLGELYPEERTFAMIQLSEQRHIEAARRLCEKYGVDTSYVQLDNVGNFELLTMQKLYDTCVEQGRINKLEALNVGEFIEITDIDDLEDAQIDMPSDIVSVYDNLKAGSYNHLGAFRRAIKRTQA